MANIVVLATGGTIAGQGVDAGDGVAYKAAQLSVDSLLHSIPKLQQLLGTDTIQSEQVGQINSKDMDFALWQILAQRCAYWLAQPTVRSLVITHGTDTLEETAFFLQQALAASPEAPLWQDKAVVLTCAMRPATARLSDGSQNLADAISLTHDPHARGVMVMVAGSVHAADTVQKNHPYQLNAFSSGDEGPLAYLEEGHTRWLRLPCGWPQAMSKSLWQTLLYTPVADWPWVEVLHSHTGADARALQALIHAGVQGIVLAGTGNATLHQALEQTARTALENGTAIVLAPRCQAGAVVRSDSSPADPVPLAWHRCGPNNQAMVLPVSKARILLLLSLLEQTGTIPATF